MAADRYGIKTTAFCEIDTNCHKVLKHHWPGLPIYDDVRKVNGAEIEPADIVTFGSPCQDLSVAGKRQGIEGGRSGLFYEAVRIIREMREATNGVYPRIAVWENVPGAFSSNQGADFRTVLEEIAETEIPMPYSGRWAESGLVRSDKCEIAWRILDAQYWGVPQRRKRIFLVADFRGSRAGEILFKPEGVSWDSQESGAAREEAAATVGDGVEEPNCLTPWDCQSKRIYGVNSRWPTLYSGEGGGAKNQAVMVKAQCLTTGTGRRYDAETETLIIEPRSQDGVCRIHDGIVPTLNTAQGGQRQPCAISPQAIAYGIKTAHTGSNGCGITEKKGYTLDCAQGQAVAFACNQRDEVRDMKDKSGALQAQTGMKQQAFIAQPSERSGECVNAIEANTREILQKLWGEIGKEAFTQWGFGVLVSLQQEEILRSEVYGRVLGKDREAPKENYMDSQRGQGDSPENERPNIEQSELREVREYIKEIGHTPQGREYLEQFARELDGIMQELPQFNTPQKSNVQDMWGTCKGLRILQQALHSLQEVRESSLHQVRYAVRRLTPKEALRLQGFPDDWLDVEGASDTAKYKAIGNSIAVPCVDYIMQGIREAVSHERQTNLR